MIQSKLSLLQIINIKAMKDFLVKEEGIYLYPNANKASNNETLKAINRKLSIICTNNYTLDSDLNLY